MLQIVVADTIIEAIAPSSTEAIRRGAGQSHEGECHSVWALLQAARIFADRPSMLLGAPENPCPVASGVVQGEAGRFIHSEAP